MTLKERRREKRRKLLGLLYDLMPVGEEQPNVSVSALATTIDDPDLSRSTIDTCVREFTAMGILERRLTWGTGSDTGRHFHWTLRVPRATAMELLDEADRVEASGKKPVYPGLQINPKASKKEPIMAPVPEATAVRQANGEAVEAIAGPEPEKPFAGLVVLRKDEAGALVEAARQYKTRTKTVHTKIDELAKTARELGISIDIDMVEAAMTVDHDERLETISLVLPYIEQLESTVNRLASDIGQYKAKAKELDDLRVENRKIKQQNERLIAAKAAAVAPPN